MGGPIERFGSRVKKDTRSRHGPPRSQTKKPIVFDHLHGGFFAQLNCGLYIIACTGISGMPAGGKHPKAHSYIGEMDGPINR
jgi:hypothetical protein